MPQIRVDRATLEEVRRLTREFFIDENDIVPVPTFNATRWLDKAGTVLRTLADPKNELPDR